MQLRAPEISTPKAFHCRMGSGVFFPGPHLYLNTDSGKRLPTPLASARRGLTLVEMLISLACVLILMMAYTTLFSSVGTSINDARSMIELSNRMRSAENMLRTDLSGVTCDMTPWQRPESGAGYFEILEGALSDRNPGLPAGNLYPLGDTDDVLMFTARSRGTPFVGRNGAGQRVEAEAAEIVWFLRPTIKADPIVASSTPTDPPTYTLYRRMFLVTPSLEPRQIAPGSPGGFADGQYDRSMHLDTVNNKMVPNTLGDLTKRENRAAHTGNFPHRVSPAMVVPFGGKVPGGAYSIDPALATHDRYGEDVVLTNVIGFDVKVWDPAAEVRMSGTTAVTPGDPGYASATSASSNPTGAYVDPYYATYGVSVSPATSFSGTGDAKSQLQAIFPPIASLDYKNSWLNGISASLHPAVYDTWSFSYENDGDPANGSDAGTNGFDDDGVNGVDDPVERDTSPPYPVPLRGIKVTIRCYDPDSRQVREISVVESYVPE